MNCALINFPAKAYLQRNLAGPLAMQQQPAAHDVRKSAQVLPFRRPGAVAPKPLASVTKLPLGQHMQRADDDFARFEEAPDEPLNERQRMLMNLIGAGIVVLLIGSGVWIADTIQMAVKKQDCALQGRTNCAPIELPARH
jgi:hypothetical protein